MTTRLRMTCLLGALALTGCQDAPVSLGSDALGSAGAGGDVGDGPPRGGDSSDGTSAGDGAGTGNGNGDNGTGMPGDGTGDTAPAGDGDGDGAADPGTGGDDGSDDTGAGATCGSRGLAPCGDGLFCNHPPSAACGATDIPGTCEPIPDACIEVLDPVCGCDGSTYGNACEAASNSVSVQSEGACTGGDPGNPTGGSGDMCGGFAGFACPAGEYCNYALGDGCAIADGLGVCQTQPQACTREYDPVCGCDGQTYGNPCSAAAAGASIAALGECGSGSGSACGGGTTCGANQHCEGASGNACGVDDGTCVDGPTACTLEFAPVCGCDGVEYGNGCSATAAGAGIARQGGC